AGLIGWYSYTHTADYLAREQLAEADRLAAEGKLVEAASNYREVALGKTNHARTALTSFNALLDGPMEKASLDEAVKVIRIGVELHDRDKDLPDLARCGLAVADRYGKSDPRGAVEVLELVAPLTKDAGALTKRRRQIWERIVKKEPNNAE